MDIKLIISLVVLIASVVAYVAASKQRRQVDRRTIGQLKTEVLRDIANVQALQAQVSPLFLPAVVAAIETLVPSYDERAKVRRSRDEFVKQVDDVDELERYVRSTAEEAIGRESLSRIRNRLAEIQRWHGRLLASCPPEVLKVMEGNNTQTAASSASPLKP